MGVIQMERVINQVSIVSLDLLYNLYTYTLFLNTEKFDAMELKSQYCGRIIIYNIYMISV